MRDPRGFHGINAHIPADKLQIIDACAELGVSWIRIDFDWQHIEPTPGHRNWDRCEAVVQRARDRHGLNIMATLSYPPGWANGGKGHLYPADNVADWKGFVSAAVERFAGRIKHWGLGNEGNHPGFFKADFDDYISKVLIPGAEAVKAADRSCFVLGPDLADHDPDREEVEDRLGRARRAASLVRRIDMFGKLFRVIHRAGHHIDILTHHIYKNPNAKDFVLSRVMPLRLLTRCHRIRRARAGLSPKNELWITETGWETKGDISEEQQAANIEAMLRLLRPLRLAHKVFIYDTVDDLSHPDSDKWMRFGLMREDLSRKPSYGAYQRWISEHGP